MHETQQDRDAAAIEAATQHFENLARQPAGPRGPAVRITVGRVVHFYPSVPGEPVAAVTIGVYGEGAPMAADLFVMQPNAAGVALSAVEFSDEPRAGCWTWQPVQRNQRPDVGAPAPVRPPADVPEHIVQFFAFGHLPEHLQIVSKPFGELAAMIVGTLPRNPERTVALRKLLESKDAAVRALLAKEAR